MHRPSVFLLLSLCLTSLSTIRAADKASPNVATHKQVFKLTPKRDGRSVSLNTFTVNSEGNILACVRDTAEDSEPSTFWLQVYSPERVLLKEISLPFDATAINQAPSGMIFVAGSGRMGRISKNGELLATADAPHLVDRDALLKEAKKSIKEETEEQAQFYKDQLERLGKKIKSLEQKTEPSERDKKRLKSLRSQLKMFAEEEAYLVKDTADYYSVESILADAMQVTSLAVNSKNVFLCCNSGVVYDVWRTDHNFSSPSKIVTDLSGCCGQCDIQVDEQNLILAENTKFKVSLLDLDGKRLTSFGSKAGEAGDGFASCCNPMNVRCCSNGDILTAESSIGWIKRYTKAGKFVGTVGKAKIGGGCKHVAIGFDEKLNRYYMQYEDKDQICVMLPLTEAPEFTVDELKAKEAMEGLGKLLSGDGKTTSNEWSVDGTRPKFADEEFQQAQSTDANAEMDDEDLGNDDYDDYSEMMFNDSYEPLSYMKFSVDGQLTRKGGDLKYGLNTWEAVSQNLAKRTLLIFQLEDGIQFAKYKIRFVDDNTMKLSVIDSDDSVLETVTFKRLPLAKN